MKPIHLRATRSPVPECSSYEDEDAVREYERAVRAHRAFAEPYSITPLDDRADGAYRVSSQTGAPYVVDIVDRSGVHDACTCPDFSTNTLGTCKHVEAVHRGLGGSRSLLPRLRALPETAMVPTVAVDAEAVAPTLRPAGKWSERLLRRHQLTMRYGNLHAAPGTTLAAGLGEDGVRVVHAAPLAWARIEKRRWILRRRRTIERAFAEKRLGSDLLSEALFPYQTHGLAHLASAGRALLADDMGLGKTVQAIAACELLRARGEADRVLIVTVASLKDQWRKEIERFTGERAIVVAGGAASRRRALETDAPYKVLNYEQTWRELSLIEELDADIVIFDEAQRAKNFRTKTAGTLRAIPSRFLFVLTGTPIENRLDDLYSLLQLVDPDILGPLWRFNLEFHRQNEDGKITGYRNLSELRRRIAPAVLRRRKEEVLTQLPPLTEQTRYTPLTKMQKELEGGYRADAAILLRIAERRPLTKQEQERLMGKLIKARQACNAVELCDPKRNDSASPKLDEFAALMSEIASQGSAKALVFSDWVEMLKLAAERLDTLGIGYTMLHGGIPTEKRPALLDRFRDSEKTRVLLSTDAGGVGLNLQVATYVVHLDLPWNPGKLDQRTARAHRLGQTRGVSVTYLCAEEGIERGIESALAGKRNIRSAALDVSSNVETAEAPSFMVFLRELKEVLDATDEDDRVEPETRMLAAEGIVDAEYRIESADPEPASPPIEAIRSNNEENAAPSTGHAPSLAETSLVLGNLRAAEGLNPGPFTAEMQNVPTRAHQRLRLADVVLRAGFFGDAVRAAYEALSSAIASLLEGSAPTSHALLVAAIFRELLPQGRIPAAAHAALARLNDLATLESSGVPVDATLAECAVRDAREWVDRLDQPAVDAGAEGRTKAQLEHRAEVVQ